MKASEIYTQITKRNGLYNIQAINNIPSIMKYGLLSNKKAEEIPHISIAMNEIQQRRDAVLLPNNVPLHEYANLYFDSRNPMLYKRRNLYNDICILVFDTSILDIEGVIVSDQNASSNYANFYLPKLGLQAIDFNLVFALDWNDNIESELFRKRSIKCAEVLVPEAIPFDYLLYAAVNNDIAANNLMEIGFNRKIYFEERLFF